MTTEMAEALLRKFTPRQLEYGYLLVTTGCTDQQIAALMGVEPHSTWHLASAWFAILAVLYETSPVTDDDFDNDPDKN